MKWTKELRRDAVEWDVVNWSRAIEFWNVERLCATGPSRVLDLESRGSGLPMRLLRLGLPDTYCSEVGSQDYLYACFGLRSPQMAARIACFAAEN